MQSLPKILKGYFLNPRTRRRRERANSEAVEGFKPITFKDFIALSVPQRESLLSPILPEKGLAMLYAPRGLGKSWLGLSVGLAVAGGVSFLRWSSPKPRHVFYVDGEMPIADLQTRLEMIGIGLGVDISDDHFRILAADHSDREINLGSIEGQKALEEHLTGIDLLIIDNLSTLTSVSENGSDAWLPIQNWLLRLRRMGLAVLLIHHAGLNGRQRGTSRREDALDTVIALRHPEDYSPDQGARFEVHIEKLRHRAGDGALPFEAGVEGFTNRAGKAAVRWVCRDLRPPILLQAAALYRQGLTVRQVEFALGISHGEAGRLRQRAKAKGLLDPPRETRSRSGKRLLAAI